MSTKELLIKIEERFNEKLELKNGWGKNEVKMVYKDAMNEVLLELSEQLITKE